MSWKFQESDEALHIASKTHKISLNGLDRAMRSKPQYCHDTSCGAHAWASRRTPLISEQDAWIQSNDTKMRQKNSEIMWNRQGALLSLYAFAPLNRPLSIMVVWHAPCTGATLGNHDNMRIEARMLVSLMNLVEATEVLEGHGGHGIFPYKQLVARPSESECPHGLFHPWLKA